MLNYTFIDMDAGPSRVPAAPGEKTHVERASNGDGRSASASATPARQRFTPGESPYHESSQFKHWRYSKAGIAKLRLELNEKSREVTERNVEAEKVGNGVRSDSRKRRRRWDKTLNHHHRPRTSRLRMNFC